MSDGRGYFALGLVRPKEKANFGEIMRAAGCYGAAMVALQAPRFQFSAVDTTKSHRHLPVVLATDILDALPVSALAIGIEFRDDAVDIREFKHPQSAFYIFGPENGSIDDAVLDRCHSVVAIPTRLCLNLAACVSTVLYDRLAKNSARKEPSNG